VWAAWLPACSVAALAAFGFGIGTGGVLLVFIGVYNAGHIALRAWGLSAGLEHGMRVASALGGPVLRRGPAHLAQVAALIGGFALPLALDQVIGPGRALFGIVLAAVALGGVVLARLHGRAEGWKIGIGLLALFVLYSVAR
jgi:PTS system mannose-specific IID component